MGFGGNDDDDDDNYSNQITCVGHYYQCLVILNVSILLYFNVNKFKILI